jgi:hypothetical protein
VQHRLKGRSRLQVNGRQSITGHNRINRIVLEFLGKL